MLPLNKLHNMSLLPDRAPGCSPSTSDNTFSTLREANNSSYSLPSKPLMGELTTEKRQWLQQHPVPENVHGRTQIKDIARMYAGNEAEARRVGITPKTISEYYNVPVPSLKTMISKHKKKTVLPAELTSIQSDWLGKNPVPATRWGEVKSTSLAKFICERKAELNELKIDDIQLITYCKADADNVTKRIYDFNKKMAGQKMKAATARKQNLATCSQRLTAAVKSKLSCYPLQLDSDNPVKSTAVARIWLENKKVLKSQGLDKVDLATFHRITMPALNSQLYKLKQEARNPFCSLNATAKQWLEQHGPKKDVTGRAPAKVVAAFWLASEEQLKSQNIGLAMLASEYGINDSFLNINVKMLVNKTQGLQLTKKQQRWLIKNGPEKNIEGKGIARQVAIFYLNSINMLKEQRIPMLELACWYQINYGTLCDNIKIVRKKIAPTTSLSADALAWLNQLLPEGERKTHTVAQVCINQHEQLQRFGLNINDIAGHFNISYYRLQRLIREINKQKHIDTQEVFVDAAAAISIKSEPVEEGGAEPWYLPQIFSNRPVLIPPSDEEIALGHAEGPIREMLMNVDISTLTIHQSPDFPQLLQAPALAAAATQRLRYLVASAQQGELNTVARQEGYYYLCVDEETPQLGMQVIAAKDMPEGFLLGLYSGVLYSSYQEYITAADNGDINVPRYMFTTRTLRPRKKTGHYNKRPEEVRGAIGGHVRSGPMAYVNTAEISADGTVIASQKNNLAAVKCGKDIIAYVTRRPIKAKEALLVYYGANYIVPEHQPIKQEPV